MITCVSSLLVCYNSSEICKTWYICLLPTESDNKKNIGSDRNMYIGSHIFFPQEDKIMIALLCLRLAGSRRLWWFGLLRFWHAECDLLGLG